MLLNKKHNIIPDLDIFARVGKAVAYDEVTKFEISNGQLLVRGETSNFKGTLSVEFSKVRCMQRSNSEQHVTLAKTLIIAKYFGLFFDLCSYERPLADTCFMICEFLLCPKMLFITSQYSISKKRTNFPILYIVWLILECLPTYPPCREVRITQK